ncbi:MAG: helicase-associated domain-containing protein [Cellulomonadaceae bacterium]|jgi:hypothetical protein|nr:helicase-associated domain-containing protein [Cellulomonadaceae bacterium]
MGIFTDWASALDSARLCDALLREWDANPPHERRTGGLADRDVRATARALGVSERRAHDVIDLARAARLLASNRTVSRFATGSGGATRSFFVPTSLYDQWRAATDEDRVAWLAQSWAVRTGVAPQPLAGQPPPMVSEIIVQGDLTGVIPGRPDPDLRNLVTDAAVVESFGAATTVRFTQESIGHALTHGWTAQGLREALTARCPFPLPQALDYTITDTERRLDPHLSPALPLPVATRPVWRAPVGGGAADAAGDLIETVTVIHEAIRSGATIVVQLAGSRGDVETRTLQPVSFEGGRLRAIDPARETELTVVVHRIVSARPAGEEDRT